jgi:hypothetical protein
MSKTNQKKNKKWLKKAKKIAKKKKQNCKILFYIILFSIKI